MYCFKCGAELADASSFCSKCGAQVSDGVKSQSSRLEPPPLPPTEPVSSAQPAAHAGPATEVGRYAGFWRRVAAAMIDGIIQVGAALMIVGLVLGMAGGDDVNWSEDAFGGLYYLLTWGGGWLYYSLMHSSSWQATLGKRALGIKVTSLSGERIS
jgi:hypothetical protein